MQEKYEKLITAKKQNYYKSLLGRHRNDLKKTWRTMNDLLGRSKPNLTKVFSINGQETSDPVEIADHFNSHFSTIGNKMVERFTHTRRDDFKQYMGHPSKTSMFLAPTTAFEVQNILKSFRPKTSCGIDGIPFKVIRMMPWNCICALAHIFNCSLQSGKYIDQFKLSKVMPLFKKGNAKDVKNYRPISLLPAFSKILEKIMYKRLNHFLDQKNFFYSQQFGFRQNHSTSHATSLLVSKILEGFDKNEYTLSMFLDLSKAFDSIDHDILLAKLHHIGVRGQSYNWFKSYLSGRKQVVIYNDVASSTYCNLTVGTLQGSILAPLCFSIIINDFPNSLLHSDIILFADDSTPYLRGKNLPELLTKANTDLENIQAWLSANKLTINVDKTKYMIFSTPKQKCPTLQQNLELNGINIERVNQTRFLGVMIDDKLSWKQHTNMVLSKTRSSLSAITKIANYLNTSCLISLYHSLIESHIRYCASAYVHRQSSILKKIQSVCNRFIRRVFHRGNREKIDDLFKEHRLLRVVDLAKFELCNMMFSCHIGELPSSLNSLFQANPNSNSRNKDNFFIPFVSKSISQESIAVCGPKAWNSLPDDIKNSKSNSEFRSKLKQYILSSY